MSIKVTLSIGLHLLHHPLTRVICHASISFSWTRGGVELQSYYLLWWMLPLLKAREPSHLEVIVTRPLMLWRSARRSGKNEWDQDMLSSSTSSATSHSVATTLTRLTIQMAFNLGEYEAWKQCHAFTSTANLASTAGTHAFLASRSLWVIDSRASTHMTGTPFIISSLTPTTTYPLVSIEDGFTCCIKGCGSTKPTPSLYVMFYMFLAFPLTFFLLVSLPIHLIVLLFSTLFIASSRTFVLVRGLV